MNKNRTTTGERIALAREVYRLTQGQLGATLGVTRAAVSQYEQDKIRPRPKVITRLAAAFNVDPEWFEHGEGRAPDPLDVPVTILVVNVACLTPEIANLRDLRTGREWQLPAATFEGIRIDPDHMVAIQAPNDAAPIARGDRVLIDTRCREGAGVFLVVGAVGGQLRCLEMNKPSLVAGRAVAYLRTL